MSEVEKAEFKCACTKRAKTYDKYISYLTDFLIPKKIDEIFESFG